MRLSLASSFPLTKIWVLWLGYPPAPVAKQNKRAVGIDLTRDKEDKELARAEDSAKQSGLPFSEKRSSSPPGPTEVSNDGVESMVIRLEATGDGADNHAAVKDTTSQHIEGSDSCAQSIATATANEERSESPMRGSQPLSIAPSTAVPLSTTQVASPPSFLHPRAEAAPSTLEQQVIEMGDDSLASAPTSSGSSPSSAGSDGDDSIESAGVMEDFTCGIDSWLEDLHGSGRQEFFGLFKSDLTPQFSRPALLLLGRNVRFVSFRHYAALVIETCTPSSGWPT